MASATCRSLPHALGCRRQWWLGYRRAAWMAETRLGAVTVVAGPLGLIVIALCAVVLNVPVWIAWYWLVRWG